MDDLKAELEHTTEPSYAETLRAKKIKVLQAITVNLPLSHAEDPLSTFPAIYLRLLGLWTGLGGVGDNFNKKEVIRLLREEADNVLRT